MPTATSPIASHFDLLPCFVVGSPRSGTTLMSVLLGRHSEIAATPETEFLSHLWFAGKLDTGTTASGTHQQVIEVGWRHCPALEDLHLDRVDVLRRFERHEPTQAGLLRAILEEFAVQQQRKTVVEGTPHHLRFVPTLAKWFPEAKFVCMMRDGRDYAESMLAEDWSGNSRAYLASLWAHNAELADRYRREFADRFLVVRYEDLVARPRNEVARVCAFVDIEEEPQMIEAGAPSSAVPPRLADRKQRELSPIDASSVGRWKRRTSAEDAELMAVMMNRWLGHWGYEVLDVRKRGRVGHHWLQLRTLPLRRLPYPLLMHAARIRRRARDTVQRRRSAPPDASG